jgi:DNA-binding HxlR family transcriptional regulator
MEEKDNKFRSECPICSGLDVVGDKWSLIIIRDMLLLGKKTFKEFSESGEKIATNILTSRLKKLTDFNIIVKVKAKHNKKSNIYILSEKGIRLTPLIAEIAIWSDENMKEFHSTMNTEDMENLRENKSQMIDSIQSNYRMNNERVKI